MSKNLHSARPLRTKMRQSSAVLLDDKLLKLGAGKRKSAVRELVSSRAMQEEGISRTKIMRMEQAGELERVGRGLYRQVDGPVTEHHDLKVAVAQAGKKVVVVVLSALRFHGIGTQVAHAVWLQIPAQARKPALRWPPVRIVRTRLAAAFTAGVETHDLEGMPIRVTNPARTVADCFKYRREIGLEACLEALREVLRRDRNVMQELTRHARRNRVLRIMQPYLEALA